MTLLPVPEQLGCYFDIGFIPPIAAMLLRWPDQVRTLVETRQLPGREILHCPLPTRFGIRIRRQAEDAYHLSMVWDSIYRQWFSLRRREILGTAIEPVLASMGTKLEYLLDQPIGLPGQSLPGAA